jgi:hypothetical protein
VTEQWPVPGHSFWYKAEIKLDSGYRLAFDLTLPSAVSEFHLSTVRLGRHGGVADDDLIFRARLYERIGAVAVAGGHAETAMKRLLLLLKGDGGHFSLVDKTWTDLHKALAAECEGPNADPRREQLRHVLTWGEENRIKSRRDNVIHAYWWNFDGCGAVRSRFYRRKDGAQMVGSLEDLEHDADLVFEYASRLDDLLGEEWPRAMLPAL